MTLRSGVLKCAFFLVSASILALPASAAVERLDDTPSPRARVQAATVLSDEGRPLGETFGATGAVLRFGPVDYRLATSRFMGQRARIYYVIPAIVQGLMSPAALRVEWQSHGRFASGSGQPGDRVPVWSGTVTTPFMEETLELSMRLDLRYLRLPKGADFGLESYFEIETLP